ncbi:MAG: hypothetical protein WCQ72_04465 [Eubacteriales bacterium]
MFIKRHLVKSTALLLCALLLMSAASCGSGSAPSENTPSTQAEDTTAAETTAQPEEAPDFDTCDFEGKGFKVLTFDWGLYTEYFFADEQTGDQMNDAIYERTAKTEEYLGCDVTYELAPTVFEMVSKVQKSVLAGNDDYQLALTHCIQDVANLISGGYLYDWNDIPNINFSKSWWNQNIIDQLSIKGKTYYAVSDYMIADPNAILFNKEIAANYAIDNPYDIVRNGQWTLDKLIELSGKVSSDIDGNGKYDQNDMYGFTVEGDWILNSIPYGCDQYLVEQNDDGSYSLAMSGEKMINIVSKVHSFLKEGHSAYTWKYGTATDKQIMIGSGRTLFNMVTLHDVSTFRQSEVEFGILPYPKYDEAQESYISNDWGGLMCVPATIGDTELVGKTIETLSYYSTSTTIPAYYETLLNGKLARDDDSVEMLDLIYGNLVYDAGLNYFGFGTNMFNLFYAVKNLVIEKNSADFASWYAKYKDGSQAEMDEFFDTVSQNL